MKYLLLLLLCFSAAAGAADRFVQVTTNGALVSPTDFFTINSNLIVSAISGAFGTGSGSGDVVGPFSAPDGALVVFDGTTGKLIKSATVTESQILTESEASSFYAPLNSPAFTGTVTFDSGTFGTLTITTNLFVADVAYGAGWDSSTNVPTRNAVYDKIQSLLTLFQATNANLTTLAALNGGSLTNLDGSKITSGQIPIARMATGTPDGTKFVRDDGTLATPAGSVTSVGATSTIAGLNFSGTPVTGAGTLSLTGVVGVASIDSAVATDAELAAHAALTNSHGVSTLGALLSAQTTTANFRTQLGIGSAALKTDTDFQATNAALTALAGNPSLYQATNAALTALAGNPQLYQSTNASLTALAANPQIYQATNAALTALAGNPALYQATNSNLSRIGAISSSAGNLIVRDATGWTNLANGTAGQVLTATASGQAWSNAAAGGGSYPTTTRGDLIVRGASADQRLAIGASGERLFSDGTDVAWTSTRNVHMDDSFVSLPSDVSKPWGQHAWVGVGSLNVAGTRTNNWAGNFYMYASAALSEFYIPNSLQFGGGTHKLTVTTKTGPNIMNSSDVFEWQLGYSSTSSSGLPSDAAMFLASTNNANWMVFTASGGSSNVVSTGVPIAGNTFYKFEVSVNAAASSIDYKINGTTVNTISANVPTAAIGMAFKQIWRSGSTDRYIYVNRVITDIQFTNAP